MKISNKKAVDACTDIPCNDKPDYYAGAVACLTGAIDSLAQAAKDGDEKALDIISSLGVLILELSPQENQA